MKLFIMQILTFTTIFASITYECKTIEIDDTSKDRIIGAHPEILVRDTYFHINRRELYLMSEEKKLNNTFTFTGRSIHFTGTLDMPYDMYTRKPNEKYIYLYLYRDDNRGILFFNYPYQDSINYTFTNCKVIQSPTTN